MELSNTAVPRYFGRYREDVLNGLIPVNEEVSMQMNRINQLIADPQYFYDPAPVEGFIKYAEGELTLANGDPLHLLDIFKVWAEEVLCWFYFEEREVFEPYTDGFGGRFVTKSIKLRLINKQFIIVARGGAKSMYASLMQAYFLIMDAETTHQITTAPTMAQANEVMAAFQTAINRAPGPLFQFLTWGSLQNTTGNRNQRQQLASTKKGIQNFVTNSLLEIRPMAVDKLQGLRSKYITIDEWLSGDVREDVVGALEQGASKQDNWLIIAISSEGTVRNGPGDTIKMELMKILRGEFHAPNVSIWHYKLDDVKEVGNPAMWPKANPNIGKTVAWEVYHRDVVRAEKAPAAANDILAKRFGLPVEGHAYFFTFEETIPVKDKRDYSGMVCALGADLSQGDDFCAFTFLFPLSRERFGIKTRSYITSLKLNSLHGAMRHKYQEFMDEGTLVIMEGATLDMEEVYDDLMAFVELPQNRYEIRALGYDPYNAIEFVRKYTQENGEYAVEKVIQGVKTESVPLGELKNMSEELLKGEAHRMLIFDEKLMQFAMGNSVVLEDTNGNRKLYKLRADEKIDNVSALMDAYIAWKRNKEAFI